MKEIDEKDMEKATGGSRLLEDYKIARSCDKFAPRHEAYEAMPADLRFCFDCSYYKRDGLSDVCCAP